MSHFKKEEFGSLEEAERNRYWQIKLSKSSVYDFLSNEHNLISKLCWQFLTLIMFIPLFITAKYYSIKYNRNHLHPDKPKFLSYQRFTEIYPGCVYSPLIKAYELELFKKCEIKEPILEIGVGDGYFSSLLFEAKKKKVTFGADLMYGVLKSARRYHHCENYIIMDASEIPLPDNSLETVIMNNLMHHLPNRMLQLEEVLRVLKKGGRLIFTDNTLGWGLYTWEQILLRRFHCKALADRILKFKLNLFAQRLLVDDDFYDNKAKDMNFIIKKKINFISKTTMYLSSVFEFLNLKQGQPTRPEMQKWFDIFGSKNKIQSCMADIIEYCYQIDRKQCEEGGFAFQFLEIEKTKSSGRNADGFTFVPFVCPHCKGVLNKSDSSFSCNQCEIIYPIFDGIPIFLSYQNKLDGFSSYLTKKKERPAENYMT
ncbi:MAG: methyltransferase domain-containing protein [Desulfobaccales bacterium]